MSSILKTYNRKKISFNRGKGSFLYDTKGKKYLDFVQGIAVNCLGHSHNHLIKSIYKQSKKLWHVSRDSSTAKPLMVARAKITHWCSAQAR